MPRVVVGCRAESDEKFVVLFASDRGQVRTPSAEREGITLDQCRGLDRSRQFFAPRKGESGRQGLNANSVAWREPLARIMHSRAQPVATEPTDVAAASAARTGERPDPADLENPALYINRELSWLEFNQRVLLQAQDERHPLLERVKFLSIVSTNLDEFFMVRVATLLRKFRTESEALSPDGMSTEQQLDAIRMRTKRMMDDVERCWSDVLRPLLAAHRIRILDPDDYARQSRSTCTTTTAGTSIRC